MSGHRLQNQNNNLSKTFVVQDQIIDQLRADHLVLREALETERTSYRDSRIAHDKELKDLQRELATLTRIGKQQELKIEEQQRDLDVTRELLSSEQRALKSLEKEHVATVKELKLKNSREYDKTNKLEMVIDHLKSELESVKEKLESERQATNLMIREHSAEVKSLRDQVRVNMTEAYRELKDRATRERDEYRELQLETEKTYKVLEEDFKSALAQKDEEMRKIKAESRVVEKELEDQLKARMKEPGVPASVVLGVYDYDGADRMRRLKNEVTVLRDQNRKLLSELQKTVDVTRLEAIKNEYYFTPFSFQLAQNDKATASESKKELVKMQQNMASIEKASRTEVSRVLGEMKSKDRQISKLQKEVSVLQQTIGKVELHNREHLEVLTRQGPELNSLNPAGGGDRRLQSAASSSVAFSRSPEQSEASCKKAKPTPPIKIPRSSEASHEKTNHVRDIIRKLQDREKLSQNGPRAVRRCRRVTGTPEGESNTANQTIEDLRAIDEDIEKLRRQIEERDKVISALREAAEAKDKKLEKLMVAARGGTDNDCSVTSTQDLRLGNRLPADSPSPPLCSSEPCWLDGFASKNYHEPVHSQLLSDHTALQTLYDELKEKFDAVSKDSGDRAAGGTGAERTCGGDAEAPGNGINLVMAEQIRALRAREAELLSAVEELREQNELMEFRILELEATQKEDMLDDPRLEKNIWSPRDAEDVSDSGVMSLPTSEDLTSDSELGETVRHYHVTERLTVFSRNHSESSDSKSKKLIKSTECLQESGIFEGSELVEASDAGCADCTDPADCHGVLTASRASQTEPQTPTAKRDDLSTEILKLSEIRKRIQEKGEGAELPTAPCCHPNTVGYYEERLSQLADKLTIYESSGDTKEQLLAKRLQKEINLSYRVKDLTQRVRFLERVNRELEEEKDEFEEAENDTRLRCQRLEARLEELMTCKAELQLELERQKAMGDRAGGKGKGGKGIEGLLNKYESRNFQLEEREGETRQRVNVMEAAMPAIMAWNMFRMCQNSDVSNMAAMQQMFGMEDPLSKSSAGGGGGGGTFGKREANNDVELFHKLEELIDDQRKLRKEYERAEEAAEFREKQLKQKIEDLEEKSAKDREILQVMTASLKKSAAASDGPAESTSLGSIHSGDLEVFEELQQLAENEVKMRRKIEELERKEHAYMQTLQQADEIWAGMEADYKKRLALSEGSEALLMEKLEGMTDQERELALKIRNLAEENKALKAQLGIVAGPGPEEKPAACTTSKGAMSSGPPAGPPAVPQAECDDKGKNLANLELTLQIQVSDMAKELAAKDQVIGELEVTVAELREELETLEKLGDADGGPCAELAKLMDSAPIDAQVEQVGADVVSTRLNEALQHMENCEICKGTIENAAISTLTKQFQTLCVLLKDRIGESEKAANDERVVEMHPDEDLAEKIPVVVMSPSDPAEPLEVDLKGVVSPPHSVVLLPSPPLGVKEVALEEGAGAAGPSEPIECPPLSYDWSERTITLPPLDLSKRGQGEYVVDDGTARLPEPPSEPGKKDDVAEIEKQNAKLMKNLNELEADTKIKDKQLKDLKASVLELNKQAQEKPGRTCGQSGLETLSTLQIAMDNLQSKCRTKNNMIKALLDEVKKKGSCQFEELLNTLACIDDDCPSQDFDRTKVYEYLKDCHVVDPAKPCEPLPSKQQKLALKAAPPPRSCVDIIKGKLMAATMLLQSAPPSPECGVSAPITGMREIGCDSLFLEWDVCDQPNNVIGYEVCVNGDVVHRVRSPTRNKCLLHSLDLSQRFVITLYPVCTTGRSSTCTTVIYPDDKKSS